MHSEIIQDGSLRTPIRPWLSITGLVNKCLFMCSSDYIIPFSPILSIHPLLAPPKLYRRALEGPCLLRILLRKVRGKQHTYLF